MKHKGSLAEAEFLKRIISFGWAIFIPWNDNKVDFIVDNGKALLKIQIKSIYNKPRQKRYYCRISRGYKGKKTYSRNDLDFIAVYIKRLQSWYIVPSHEFHNKTSLNIEALEEYKNKWELIGQNNANTKTKKK